MFVGNEGRRAGRPSHATVWNAFAIHQDQQLDIWALWGDGLLANERCDGLSEGVRAKWRSKGVTDNYRIVLCVNIRRRIHTLCRLS